MSERNFISEYKEIKAPEELYERIVNASDIPSKSNVVSFRRISSFAAAVLVIVTASLLLFPFGSMPEVYMGGEKLQDEVTLVTTETPGVMLVRSLGELECEITLNLKKETSLSITDGFLFDTDGNIILNKDEEKVFSEKITFRWLIPGADENIVYKINISDKNGTYFIKLYFDGQTGVWTGCLTK